VSVCPCVRVSVCPCVCVSVCLCVCVAFAILDDIYIEVDHRYADPSDGLGLAQAYLNLPEVAMGAIAYAYHTRGNIGVSWLWALIASSCTLWKTFVYFGSDAVLGFSAFAHVSNLQFYGIYIIPALPWFICPFLIIRAALAELSPLVQSGNPSTTKKRN
jgi:hypothetical protein